MTVRVDPVQAVLRVPRCRHAVGAQAKVRFHPRDELADVMPVGAHRDTPASIIFEARRPGAVAAVHHVAPRVIQRVMPESVRCGSPEGARSESLQVLRGPVIFAVQTAARAGAPRPEACQYDGSFLSAVTPALECADAPRPAGGNSPGRLLKDRQPPVPVARPYRYGLRETLAPARSRAAAREGTQEHVYLVSALAAAPHRAGASRARREDSALSFAQDRQPRENLAGSDIDRIGHTPLYRAFDQTLHSTLAQLGPDLGCRP